MEEGGDAAGLEGMEGEAVELFGEDASAACAIWLMGTGEVFARVRGAEAAGAEMIRSVSVRQLTVSLHFTSLRFTSLH